MGWTRQVCERSLGASYGGPSPRWGSWGRQPSVPTFGWWALPSHQKTLKKNRPERNCAEPKRPKHYRLADGGFSRLRPPPCVEDETQHREKDQTTGPIHVYIPRGRNSHRDEGDAKEPGSDCTCNRPEAPPLLLGLIAIKTLRHPLPSLAHATTSRMGLVAERTPTPKPFGAGRGTLANQRGIHQAQTV
jgi:hypothetical protein